MPNLETISTKDMLKELKSRFDCGVTLFYQRRSPEEFMVQCEFWGNQFTRAGLLSTELQRTVNECDEALETEGGYDD